MGASEPERCDGGEGGLVAAVHPALKGREEVARNQGRPRPWKGETHSCPTASGRNAASQGRVGTRFRLLARDHGEGTCDNQSRLLIMRQAGGHVRVCEAASGLPACPPVPEWQTGGGRASIVRYFLIRDPFTSQVPASWSHHTGVRILTCAFWGGNSVIFRL